MFTATKENPANDFSNAVKGTKKDAYNAAYEAGEGVRDAANEGVRKVRKLISSATDEACSVAKNLNTQIEGNPKQAALISLCAGFLLGALIRR